PLAMAMVDQSSWLKHCSSPGGVFNGGHERGHELREAFGLADYHQIVAGRQARGGFGHLRKTATRDWIAPLEGEDVDAVAGAWRQVRQRAAAQMRGQLDGAQLETFGQLHEYVPFLIAFSNHEVTEEL